MKRDHLLRDSPHAAAMREMSALRALVTEQRHAEALALAREITQATPRFAPGWKMLGDLLLRLGDALAALTALRTASELSPADFDVRCQLGHVAQTLGRLSEAEADYRRALRLRPKHAAAHCSLGRVLLMRGKPAEAEHCFRAALQGRPNWETYGSLGDALKTLGRLPEAEDCYRRALQLRPDFFEAYNNLGAIFHSNGLLAKAKASFERAAQLQPQFFEPHNNLGNVLLAMGSHAEAEASLLVASRLRPDLAELHNNLGNVYWAQGRLGEAESRFQRAVQLNPGCAKAHAGLGSLHVAVGRHADAGVSFRRVLNIKPDDAGAYSNLLLSLAYRADVPEEDVLHAHRQYGVQFCGPFARKWPEHAPRLRKGAKARALRVGYVSPDLHQHPVAYFISPLLRAHDPGSVEVFCYANVMHPDTTTEALRTLSAHWLSTVGISHARLAEQIAADEIDVLVDLAGHTAGNRLPVFARKPAPVQVSWLGYPNTTGVPAIEYRLVDEITDPPGEADRFATETLIRLDRGFLCYEPLADAPGPCAPPCVARDALTFGSFNNLAKLSDPTLEAWIAILAQVPRSRLLLKAHGLADEFTRNKLLSRFAGRGGDLERITLQGRIGRMSDHLAAYGQVDVALDPFPYNGTTTTCEALWMGVPVVTLRGDRHVGRVGASLLTQAGFTELIAASVDHYVDLARALAADRERLTALRETMRERMRASPLCDAQAFARKIEAVYRELWQRAARTAPEAPLVTADTAQIP